MRQAIKNRTYDQERALYHLTSTDVHNCIFAGPADGESVLKECRDLTVTNCSFSLRYPLWHASRFIIRDCAMDDQTRAPIWYSDHGQIENCRIEGIKTLRECQQVTINNCNVVSPEFGWRCRDLSINDTTLDAVYCLFESKNVQLDHVTMTGKYSFQYMNNLIIDHSNLDTKDAFWHCKNVIVRNTVLKGEYLGWFSDGLTLINCTIIGTQPLCYCKNLKLINCEMQQCDLSFEYSQVHADVRGKIDSVKNPKSGKIVADEIGEIINEGSVTPCRAKIISRKTC